MLRVISIVHSIFALACLIVLAGPTKTNAQQFACGGYPGERQVGELAGPGGSGAIPMCVRDAQDDTQTDRSTGVPDAANDPGAYANTPAFRAAQRAARTPAGRAAARQRAAEQQRALVDRQLQLMGELVSSGESPDILANYPQFVQLQEGSWQQYQEGDPPVPGQKCIATFASMQGLFSISAVGGSLDPAILLLTGPDIPQPSETVVISTSLYQTDEAMARVRAYNWTDRQAGIGTIAYAIPNLEAAIDGINDEAEVAVEVDGKRVYQLTYRGGDAAKADLTNCALGQDEAD